MATALTGTATDRKTAMRRRNDSRTTAAMTSGRRGGVLVGGVDARRGDSADESVQSGSGGRGRYDVGTEAVHELLGTRVLGRCCRDKSDHGGVTVGAEPWRRRGGDARRVGEGVVECCECDVVLTGGELDHDDQRAVGAGSESFGEEVVGAAGGEVGLSVPGVREREAHREQRQCQYDEDTERGGAGQRGAPLYDPAPFP